MFSTTAVYASNFYNENNHINIDNTNKHITNTSTSLSNKDEVILTRYRDGTIKQRTLYQVDVATQRSNMSTYVLEAKFTDLSQEIFDGGSNSSDPYGRTLVNPAENRIGQIKCNYDVDYDSDVDVVAYGTASLQHYDIIISCAHCIWDPQFADMPCDGWATEVIFYAGKTSDTSYASSANHVSMSISQDFVNNSYYTYDKNDIPVTIFDFNWDWSIIQIDQNLGGTYGWFGLHGLVYMVVANLN